MGSNQGQASPSASPPRAERSDGWLGTLEEMRRRATPRTIFHVGGAICYLIAAASFLADDHATSTVLFDVAWLIGAAASVWLLARVGRLWWRLVLLPWYQLPFLVWVLFVPPQRGEGSRVAWIACLLSIAGFWVVVMRAFVPPV